MNQLFLVTLLLCSVSIRGQSPDTAFLPVKSLGGISEFRMVANDLDVLLMEDHSAPVLTFMVTFRVGSRNEVTGTTGATHLLEHMMFKGSTHFNAALGKSFDTMMDRVGGINNASTWLDRTNYYENLPSDQLELAVQLESDRMRGLLLREEDRRPEMTVVRNEFERGENDPAEALDKEVGAAAYIAHPYHHPTIGWRSDIEKVPITKLRQFYDTFYWPDNATVTVIGDFQPAAALALLQKYFGPIPRAPAPLPIVYTEEPPQTGPRRVTVKRPGEVGAVEIAFKAPPVLHPDHAPLEVLAAIMSDGKTSRLYRALIDSNLAISADATKGYFRDNTLFTITALLAPGVMHERVEKALLAEVERLGAKGVTPDEVSRAVNKLAANAAYGRDGSFAIAGQLNEAIAIGDWTDYVREIELWKAVTPADVSRVAKHYFDLDQSTTGWFVPLAEGSGAPGEAEPRPAARGPSYYRSPSQMPAPENGESFLAAHSRAGGRLDRDGGSVPESAAGFGSDTHLAAKVHRRSVAGVDVLTMRTSIHDVVTFRGALSGGDIFNPPGNSAIADLTAGMLDKGTLAQDKFAAAARLEQVGAALSFGSGTHTANFSGKCLRKDLPLVMGLLAEELRTPRFDPEEFAKLKTQLAGERHRQMDETDYRAISAFRRAIFPVGHPGRPPADERYLADIESATLEQVKAFHAANYGPAIFRFVAVGDVDDVAVDQALLRGFSGWHGGQPLPTRPPAPELTEARTEKVAMPGKASVSFVIGEPSRLHYADADHLPLEIGTDVLGSGFFTARLLDTVRNREGLTYGIGAELTGDTFADGSWFISATFAPELLEQGAASTMRELKKFASDGVTADELAKFKVTLTGSYKLELATTGGLASILLNAVQRGYGPEWIDEYPRRINGLTREAVNAAIRRNLQVDHMMTVIAGTMPGAAK